MYIFFFVANAHTLPGLTATAWSSEAAATITDNRGINRGRCGRIKIGGCSRKQTSSGGQLSGEEPKHGRTNGGVISIFGAISRSSMIGERSSEIKSDDRAILRFTHISSHITRIIVPNLHCTTGNLLDPYRVS